MSLPQKFRQYIQLLNSDIKESLYNYAGSGYSYNRKLNSRVSLDEIELYNYNNIMKAFIGGPSIDSTIQLYRGMTTENLVDSYGFISCTDDINIAKGFVNNNCCLYIITLTPSEHSILPLFELRNKTEREYLLPPGILYIQKIVPGEIKTIYCTYSAFNAKSISMESKDVNYDIDEIVKSASELSISSWVDRITNQISRDEIELCDESEFETCIDEILNNLNIENIPRKALLQAKLFYMNLKESIFK